MLLQKGAALTLGHAAPHAELDAVVRCIGTTLSAMTGQCRQMTAAFRWAAPGRTVRRDQFCRHNALDFPCNPGFAIRTVEQAVKRCCDCPARSGWPIT